MQRLMTRNALCSGCRACEVACVVRHDGRFGTATSRIKVTKDDHAGVDTPHICRLCRKPACVSVCPTDALYRDEQTGVIHLKADACTGCSDCVDGCPFGVVTLHIDSGLPLICDLCDGNPACVKRCAPGAIFFADEEAIARERREKLAKTKQSHDERDRG